MPNQNLFSEFAPVSKADWLARVEKDLSSVGMPLAKGRPISELTWELPPLSIDPFAHADDFAELPESLAHTPSNTWEIGENIEVFNNDFKAANKQALIALMGGANAINFIVDEYPAENQLLTLIENIELDFISIHFTEKTNGVNPLDFLKTLHSIAINQGKNLQTLRGSVSYNPLTEQQKDGQKAGELIQWASQNLPQFKVLSIDGGQFFKGSENVVEELTQTLLAANDYINLLKNNDLNIENINDFIKFNFNIGISYFIEIAKLRAFKLLWANVLDAHGFNNPSNSGSKNLAPTIHAYISPETQVEDVHTNKIRATTQAMSAVLGGVNMLTIAPSDALSTESSDFSRRIARNVQHLLQMESYLDKVADPAAGSFYIEKLTNQIAEAVWQQFQERAV